MFCTRHGLTFQEACNMNPVERRAWYFTIARQEGFEIDWQTGKVSLPESKG